MSDGLDALRRYEVVSAGDPYGAKVAPEPVPVVSHPAPEVSARAAMPDEVPNSARLLIRAARTGGWEWRAEYARGAPMLGGELQDSVVVRLRKRHQMAVGVWAQGKFTSGWTWAAAHSAEGAEGYGQVGYRSLVKHVKAAPGDNDALF